MATDKTESRKQEAEDATRDGSLKESRVLVAAQPATDDIVRDGTLKEARAFEDGQDAQPDRSI